MAHRRWTPEEADYLSRHHRATPRDQLVRLLGRTAGSVSGKLVALGLAKRKHRTGCRKGDPGAAERALRVALYAEMAQRRLPLRLPDAQLSMTS